MGQIFMKMSTDKNLCNNYFIMSRLKAKLNLVLKFFPQLIFFTAEIIVQYNYTNPLNLVKQ